MLTLTLWAWLTTVTNTCGYMGMITFNYAHVYRSHNIVGHRVFLPPPLMEATRSLCCKRFNHCVTPSAATSDATNREVSKSDTNHMHVHLRGYKQGNSKTIQQHPNNPFFFSKKGSCPGWDMNSLFSRHECSTN